MEEIMIPILIVLLLITGIVFGIIFFIKGIRSLMKNTIGPGLGFIITAVVIFLAIWIVWAKIITPLFKTIII
jgi:hypothetical protein